MRTLILVENLSVPFDRRVWQEAKALREAGASVTVICPRGSGRDTLLFEQLEGELGVSLVGGGRVYYRDQGGVVTCVDRPTFAGLAQHGSITAQTTVFDTTVATLGDWRSRFEAPASNSWHRTLLPSS